jgi:hypothetical protein
MRHPGGLRLPGPAVSSPGHAREAVTSSNNWSGYAASGGTGAFRSVSAYWTEPAGTCRSGQQWSSFWVGLDGDNSSTVEQTGSEVDCSGASPVYYSWYEMYPANPVVFASPVAPGDHFFGSVTHTGGSSYTLVLTDQTQGWSHTVRQSLAGAADSSAEVIAEAPCCLSSGAPLPLSNFGTVRFTGARANGAALGAANPDAILMVDLAGNEQVSVTSLNPAGKGFSATWLRQN